MQHGVRIGFKRAWVRVMALDAARMTEELEALQRCANGASEELGVLQAAAAAARDDRRSLHAFALAAGENEFAPWSAGIASVLQRLAHWQQGDLQRFHAARRPAGDTRSADCSVSAFDRALDAAVELQQLRFAVAAKLARESTDLAANAKPRSAARRFGEVLQAQVLYEQGELLQAESLLRDYFQAVRSAACADVAIMFYVLVARIAIDQHKGDLAMFVLRDGIALAEARGWPRMSAACWQELIDLLVGMEHLEEAERSVALLRSRWSDTDDVALQTALLHMQCRVQVAAGDAADALSGLLRLRESAEARGDEYACAKLDLRRVEALDACGRSEEAHAILMTVLEVGCRAGLYQSIISAGPAIHRLLQEVMFSLNSDANDRAFLQPYVSSLVNAPRQPDAMRRVQRTTKLRGPLSNREQAILLLMRHGSSNKLIARRLGIAPETVKSHAKRIYGKLGAQSRLEAVTKATSLSLI